MAIESIYHIDKTVSFRETFNSEVAVRNNGGVPTDGVLFENGIITVDLKNNNIEYPVILKNSTPEFSILFRFRINSLSPDSNIYFYNDSGTNGILIYMGREDGKIRSYIKANVTTTTNRYDDGLWHDYIMTYNGTSFSVYIDGVFTSSTSSYISKSNNTFVLSGIDSVSTNYSSGSMDSFDIYDRELNATEVQLLYSKSLYVKPKTILIKGYLVFIAKIQRLIYL